MSNLVVCRIVTTVRRLTIFLLVLLLPATFARGPARADTTVDVLLVLAADISRSLDERKFRLQREGYADAITSSRVIKAIESGPNGSIAVCLVEWSGPLAQAVVVDWTIVANAADAQRLATRIREAPRLFRDRTAIGSAIDFSTRLFEKAPATSTRRVIDVSGDGTSNAGRSIEHARQAAIAAGITINGIAILSDVPLASNPEHTHPPGGLLKYYEDNVVGGPGSFAVAAESFEAFGDSLVSKLVKEIASLDPLPVRIP